MDNTLIIGIQDIHGIPYGATLRVLQHVKTIKKTTYHNVGNRQWNSRTKLSKTLQLIRFARPWREPFAAYHYSNYSANQLIRFLKLNKFRTIIVSELWAARYLRIAKTYGKGATVILDLHNVESTLQVAIAKVKPTRLERLRVHLVTQLERFAVRHADDVWVCSNTDAEGLKEIYGVNAKVVPNRFNVNGQFQGKLTDEKTIGYVGCFNYPPNEEAALELLYRIRPSVMASLRLIGKNPSERLKSWQNENVKVTGEVVSVSDELRNVRTLVLPIRSGSGTRLKVLEGMAHGIPIVATAKAVEGLKVKDGTHYLNAETPEEFKAKIDWLWANPSEEEKMRKQARRLVEEEYAWE